MYNILQRIDERDNIVQRSDIFNGIELGFGTWSWGDRLIWGYGNGYDEEDLQASFTAAIENGIRFFDTAEVYGQGKSEITLGKFVNEIDEPLVIASKFMPYPWRIRSDALEKSLKGSLSRLGMDRLQLYQIHFPMPPVNVESWMEQLVHVMNKGLVESAGVSNYDLAHTERALNTLVKNGYRLASNQMEYNLLNRKIERTGLLKFCLEQGITLIAYSPLAMGALTGKYTPENPLGGYRNAKYDRRLLVDAQPLMKALRKIGLAHDGKTVSQVAINWVICKGALPIPGIKTAEQVEENVGSTGWRLTADEVNTLDEISDRVVSKSG